MHNGSVLLLRLQDPESSLADGLTDNVGLVAATDQPMDLLRRSSSGYAREMTAKETAKSRKGSRACVMGVDGVGATERSGRWIMALEFFLGINRLLLSWWASLTLKLLAKAGFRTQPRWLLWLVRMPKPSQDNASVPDSNDPDSLNFRFLSIDGELSIRKDEQVDVETEMRNQMRKAEEHWSEAEETNLDKNLYKWVGCKTVGGEIAIAVAPSIQTRKSWKKISPVLYLSLQPLLMSKTGNQKVRTMMGGEHQLRNPRISRGKQLQCLIPLLIPQI